MDCNAATAPNTDGCECAHPSCGGNGCASSTSCPTTTHVNGIGQSFYDCVTTGTYSQAQATEACIAFTGDANKCDFGFSCNGSGSSVANAICNVTAPGPTSTCVSHCWWYSATGSGSATSMVGKSGDCSCAPASTWN
jgi:hypothetical protein